MLGTVTLDIKKKKVKFSFYCPKKKKTTGPEWPHVSQVTKSGLNAQATFNFNLPYQSYLVSQEFSAQLQ